MINAEHNKNFRTKTRQCARGYQDGQSLTFTDLAEQYKTNIEYDAREARRKNQRERTKKRRKFDNFNLSLLSSGVKKAQHDEGENFKLNRVVTCWSWDNNTNQNTLYPIYH